MSKEAMKLALEALESCGAAHITDGGRQWYDEKLVDTAYAALQEALAEQPAHHTEQHLEMVDAYCKAWEQSFTADNPYHTVSMTAEDRKHIKAGLKAALAEQPAQQEPVGMVKDLFTNAAWDKLDVRGSTKVYLDAPPAQRTWVGLTNNELQPIADEYRILFGSWVEDFARAIEAKLKEKNT